MASPAEKGDALQQAVQSIEHMILHTSPALKENTFLIEPKKIISPGGVHHEIDVYVTIDSAAGYKSVFIFECKNWKRPVGKNEIVNFSEKIGACGAARGFFVAKKFTRDASAQAKKDVRIELVLSKELPLDGPSMLEGFHVTSTQAGQLSPPLLVRRGSDRKNVFDIDPNTAQTVYRGQVTNLWPLLLKMADAALADDTLNFRSHQFPEGTYPRSFQKTVMLEIGELTVEDVDMEAIEFQGDYTVSVFYPPIISHFDVASRGRTMTYAPVNLPMNRIFQVTMTQTDGEMVMTEGIVRRASA